jgi:hypothetical protein
MGLTRNIRKLKHTVIDQTGKNCGFLGKLQILNSEEPEFYSQIKREQRKLEKNP